MFKRFQHIEHFGRDEVYGIERGTIFVFPKLDGTNSSVWMDNGELKFGSRNKELSLDFDNADFMNKMVHDERLYKFFNKYPNLRLYGEFLVPHTITNYQPDAWGKFYVFDVTIRNDEAKQEEYLDYNTYLPLLQEFGLDYIPCLIQIDNPTVDDLRNLAYTENFLIYGDGNGEGIVIKNYQYKNQFGLQNYAKIVTDSFKDKKWEKTYVSLEEQIADKYVTQTLVDKEYSKIAIDGWNNSKIPRLLNTVTHSVIQEDMWDIVKKFNMPTIDFDKLASSIVAKTKMLLPHIFK